VSDDIVVTPLNATPAEGQTTLGVQITAKTSDWDAYKDNMVDELDPEESSSVDGEYDPVQTVSEASQRSTSNYQNASMVVKTLVNPITYLDERDNPNIPRQFNVKPGVYRMDHNGNALFRNIVAEKAQFSQLDAYRFNVNKLGVDKLVTTSVASNVVDTDNLLKSRGIAEFSGTVNCDADVFMERGSRLNVAQGADVTFQSGASLTLKSGARLVMGADT
jgi:hypothetical protein